MDLQNAFYFASLIFLTLGIIFFLGCIAFLAFLFFAFRNAKNKLGDSIDTIIDDTKKKSNTANFGLFLLGTVLKKLKNNTN